MISDYISELLGPWSAELNAGSVLLRLVLAAVLGAIIGSDRSRKLHSAGLRTFVFVSLTGAGAAIADAYLLRVSGSTIGIITAAALVSAALIGYNSIFFNAKNKLKGLTTSAGLGASAILGITAGWGLYTVTLVIFLLLFIGISALPTVEKKLKDHSRYFEIHLELKDKSALQDFVGVVRGLDIHIENLEPNSAYLNTGMCVYTVALKTAGRQKHADVIAALQTLPCVSYIEELE